MIEATMVSVLNLDKLYKVCVDKQNNSYEFVPMFKQYLHMLYSNISISIQVNNLNIYEAYMLRSFATSVTPFTDMHIDYTDIEYTPSERKLIEFYQIVQTDKKLDNMVKNDFPYYYGPCKFIKGNMCATFTGYQLINLFGDPTDFFLKLSAGACSTSDEDGKMLFKPEYVLNDTAVGTFIANTFYNKFTSFIINGYVSSDIYSAKGIRDQFSIKHDDYVPNTNNFDIKLASIINPYLKVNVLNGADMMNSGISEFKESAPKSIKDGILDNTTLEFYVCTSFDTLVDISSVLPFYMITSQEPPIDVFMGNLDVYKYDHKSLGKDYDDQLSSLSKAVVDDTLGIIKNTNPVEKKNWTSISSALFLNSTVSFNIQLTLNDVNLYVNTAIKNNKSMKTATRSILDFILKGSIAVYNKLIK